MQCREMWGCAIFWYGSTNPFDGMRSDVNKCAEVRPFRGNVASCAGVEDEGSSGRTMVAREAEYTTELSTVCWLTFQSTEAK